MKALIVDDNIAIQEILKDILNENGHIVKIAGSINDAIDDVIDFEPDVIILDTVINGGDGLQVLSRIAETCPYRMTNVVLIKNLNDETPKDNSYIKAVVTKPFKSSDIVAAMDIVSGKETPAATEVPEVNPRDKVRSMFRKLTNDRDQDKTEERQTPPPNPNQSMLGPEYGKSYVFFEREPDKVYDLMEFMGPEDYSILMISSENAKVVKKKFKYDHLDVVTLSSHGRGKSMDVNKLGTLTAYIKEYISSHDSPIVIMDNLTDIVDNNGLNRTLVFMHQLVRSNMGPKTPTFIVSIDPSILTTKDRNILLGDMSEYVFR